jgi:hypothetical protein
MTANSASEQLFGPDGTVLTLEGLPASGPKRRWSMLRKGRVIAAVHSGLLTLDEACAKYTMSADEFFAWENALQRHGLAGLRATNRNPARH